MDSDEVAVSAVCVFLWGEFGGTEASLLPAVGDLDIDVFGLGTGSAATSRDRESRSTYIQHCDRRCHRNFVRAAPSVRASGRFISHGRRVEGSAALDQELLGRCVLAFQPSPR